METLKKIFIFALIILMTFWLIVRLKNFKYSTSDTAMFEEVLNPLNEKLKPSTKVSYFNPDNQVYFFYKTQFCVIPVVLERNGNRDSLIFFCENKNLQYTDTSFFANYNKIASYKNSRFTVFLLIKNQ